MARRTRKIGLGDQLERFTKDHILAVRRTRGGEISSLKHVQFGWISPHRYYLLQKTHELMPLVQEFVHGGYRAKQALWSMDLSILGIELPIGASLPVAEAWNLWAELNRQPIDPVMLMVRAYALLGPWGDIIQLIDSTAAAASIVEQTAEAAKKVLDSFIPPTGQRAPPPGLYPVPTLPTTRPIYWPWPLPWPL